MTASLQPRSVSVWKTLGAAAVLGVTAGLVLARQHRPPDEFDVQAAEREALKAMPGGAPLVRPEQPAKQAEDFMAPDPRSLRGIPPYPGAPLPRRLHSSHPAAGQTMAISWFETGDSVDDVVGFYERAFAGANVVYTSHRFNRNRGYASWFEHDRTTEVPEFGKGLLHMVTASREGEKTVVLVSVSEPQKILENLTPLPSGVRLPPGTTPQVMNLSELGQQRASIIAEYELPPEQLRSELARVWREDGWTLAEGDEGGGAGEVVVVNKAQRQTVSLEARGAGTQLVIMLEERSPNEGASP